MLNPKVLSIVEKSLELSQGCDETVNCDSCDNGGTECYSGPCDCDEVPCDDDTA